MSFLIAIEGIDGSGKTTIARRLEHTLASRGLPVIYVASREIEKEPLFHTVLEEYELDPRSPAYMFFFQVLHARKAYLARRALLAGKTVIADRWDLSFFVYHENFGFFSGELDTLRQDISRLAFGDLRPDLGIYLDVSLDRAIDRRIRRGETISSPEEEKELYAKVVSSYRSLAQHHGWTIIDANGSLDQVREATQKLVEEVINQ